MKLLNSRTINGVMDALNIGLESRPAVVSAAVTRQLAYELDLPAGRVNSVNAAFNEQLPVVERRLAEVNEQYLLPSFDGAVENTRRLWTTRYQLAHEPTNPEVIGLVDAKSDAEVPCEQLAQIAQIFSGGDAVVAVESLLYAPSELVAAGLDKASLESIISDADRPEFDRQYTQIESVQLQIAATLSAGIESLEEGFAGLESGGGEGEAATKAPDPAAQKGLLKRLADMIRKFISWVGERLTKMFDWITGGRERRQKEIEIAKEIDEVKIEKLVEIVQHAKKAAPEQAAPQATPQADSLDSSLERMQAAVDSLRRRDSNSDLGKKAAIVHLIAKHAPEYQHALAVVKSVQQAGDGANKWYHEHETTRDAARLKSMWQSMADHGYVYEGWTRLGIDGVTSTTSAALAAKAALTAMYSAADKVGPVPFTTLAHDMATAFPDGKIDDLHEIQGNAASWLKQARYAADQLEHLDTAKHTATEDGALMIRAMQRFAADRVAMLQNSIQIIQMVIGAYGACSQLVRTVVSTAASAASAVDDTTPVSEIAQKAGIKPSTMESINALRELGKK